MRVRTKGGWCVLQVETGLLDGWYFLDKSEQRGLLEYWDEMFPEYHHEITVSAPPSLENRHLINHSPEYERRVAIGSKSILQKNSEIRGGVALRSRSIFELERSSMKPWVKLHKDGAHMGVETNCTDERDFWAQFSAVLANAIENKFLGQAEEQLQRWLPQAFEVVAQLRGYKAAVTIEQIVRAGEVYSGNQEVFTSAPESDSCAI